MRRILVASLVFVLLAPASAWAQKVKRTTITADPRIGFQAGMLPGDVGKEYLFKCGMWAPLSLDIITGDEPLTNGQLSVEVSDSEDVQNTFTVPIGQLGAQKPETYASYVRVGSRGGEVVTRIYNDGTEVAMRRSSFDAMPLDDLLFIAIGSPLPGLRRALIDQRKKVGGDDNNANPNMFNQPGWNDGHVARIESVQSMPTKWFAYQGADLILLTTSNADFVKDLLSDKPRHQALMEWVVRGGKLVISGGRNSDLLPALAPEVLEAADSRKLARIKVLPGGLHLTRVPGVEAYAHHATAFEGVPAKDDDKPTPIALAHFQRKPGKDAQVLADTGEKESHPLLVRVPYGTGQIVLVAFDLDQPPFSTRWSGQSEFWDHFNKDLGVALSQHANPQFRNWGDTSSSDDVTASLYNSLQMFPEVSNISFGWVALFIFVYILVVGPLDYFFLKKVVKRLELTWITFPTVVLVVSVVAYFTAYALKGNDLLINKADLVDIDLEGQTGYGHSWFTLFSPRIQHYTIGVEPTAPAWAKPPAADDKASTVLMGWMGRPDEGYGGFGRSRSQSLFRRSYAYDHDATGLIGVPIQVWSMKSFESSWVRPVNPDKPPFTADLEFTGDAARHLQGTITNQLPVDLVDVHLVFPRGGVGSGWVYSLDKPLVRDVPQRIIGQGGQRLTDWLNLGGTVQDNTPRSNRTPPSNKDSLFKHLSFFSAREDPNSKERNVLLRHLDLTWRLRLKNEVILLARVAPQSGAAETVSNEPVTAGRLWLGSLPGSGEARVDLKGTLTQETFVRVFIPAKGGRDEGNEKVDEKEP